MPARTEEAYSVNLHKPVGWFVALELSCIAGFIALLVIGQTGLAVAVFAGALQVLAWLALTRRSWAVLVAFVALLPLAATELIPYTYQRYVYFPGTIGLLLLPVLTRFLLSDTQPLLCIPGPERISVFALASWTVLSGINAAVRGWGSRSLLAMTSLAVEVAILVYFFAITPRSLQEVRALLYVVVASMTLVAALLPSLPPGPGGGGLGGKVVATPFGQTNLNIVACGLTTVAATALGMAAATRRLAARFLLGAAVVMCVIALVVTKSRGAWLGFGVAFLYVLLRTRSVGLLLLAVAVSLTVVTSDLLRAAVLSRAGATSATDPSLLGRFVLWHYAWQIGKSNWLLGVGLENFRYVKHFYGFPMPLRFATPFNAHSLYLELFADLGIPGLANFIWLLGVSVVRAWRAAKCTRSRDIGLGLSAGIIACAGHGLSESVMFNPGVFALLGALIGLSIGLRQLTSFPETPSLVRSRPLGG